MSLYAVGTQVLADVVAALDAGATGAPKRRGMQPGAIAWDGGMACGGGLLAVSFSRMFATSEFPNEEATTGGNGCGGYSAAEFILQLVRCAPQMDALGNIPASAVDASAAQVLGDMEAIYPAVQCSLETMYDSNVIADWTVRQALAVPPQGDLVGTQIDFVVGVK